MPKRKDSSWYGPLVMLGKVYLPNGMDHFTMDGPILGAVFITFDPTPRRTLQFSTEYSFWCGFRGLNYCLQNKFTRVDDMSWQGADDCRAFDVQRWLKSLIYMVDRVTQLPTPLTDMIAQFTIPPAMMIPTYFFSTQFTNERKWFSADASFFYVKVLDALLSVEPEFQHRILSILGHQRCENLNPVFLPIWKAYKNSSVLRTMGVQTRWVEFVGANHQFLRGCLHLMSFTEKVKWGLCCSENVQHLSRVRIQEFKTQILSWKSYVLQGPL
jgi:hypothetical protein